MSPSITAVLLHRVNANPSAPVFCRSIHETGSPEPKFRALGFVGFVERCPGKGGQTAEEWAKDGDGYRDCYQPIRQQRKKR